MALIIGKVGQYFIANDVHNDLKVPSLLSIIGPKILLIVEESVCTHKALYNDIWWTH